MLAHLYYGSRGRIQVCFSLNCVGEMDDAELLAAALQEDDELEDNSVTAI